MSRMTRGMVWTTHADGNRMVTLEYATRVPEVGVQVDRSPGALRETGLPVRIQIHFAFGAPARKLDLTLPIPEWRELCHVNRGEPVLGRLLAPTVPARFRAQAWINDNAVDVDDGHEDFDALPAILTTYTRVADFVSQIPRREWDDLAPFCAAGRQHSGPFEVEIDPKLVLVLAAMYSSDSALVHDLLCDVPGAQDRLLQEDWDRLRRITEFLAPARAQQEGTPQVAAGESLESLFLEALAAFEDEEDSVRQEHAGLIRRMRALADTLPQQVREGAVDRPRMRN